MEKEFQQRLRTIYQKLRCNFRGCTFSILNMTALTILPIIAKKNIGCVDNAIVLT